MPLGEPDTLPAAIERLAINASLGLEYVAKANHLGAVEVLRRATLERLFRGDAQADSGFEGSEDRRSACGREGCIGQDTDELHP